MKIAILAATLCATLVGNSILAYRLDLANKRVEEVVQALAWHSEWMKERTVFGNHIECVPVEYNLGVVPVRKAPKH